MLNNHNSSKPGPNTPAGKHRSSQNAIRHGLAGRTVVLPTEDMDVYLEFTKEFIESLKPANPMERELAQNIADGYWRLKRVRTVEESLYARNYDPAQSELEAAIENGRTFHNYDKTFLNLSLYESRIQRNIEKNTKLLRELQAERKATEPEPAPAAIAKPPQTKPLTVVKRIVYSTPQRQPEPTTPPNALEEDLVPERALL